jgi:hypothetical protein
MSIKISELTSGTTLDGTEVLPIVQDGATVKITTQDVADLASSSGAVWGGITGDITDQTDLVTALNLKVDAVPGKGLSSNDFTNTLKTKLDGIQDGAEVNVNADWNATSGDAQILNKPTIPSITGLVPYTGATADVDLGTFHLDAAKGTFTHSGSTDTLTANHTSGSGIGLLITKGGANEGLKVNKTSGSGNAATIIGTLEATTIVKTGGTSTEFLMADGSTSLQSNPFPLFGAAMGNVIGAATPVTRFFAFLGLTANTAENQRQIPVPYAVTFKNFFCFFGVGAPQPASGSLVLTIRKNGVDTAITITIPAGSSIGTYSDTTNSESFAAGDLISVKAVNNAISVASGNITSLTLGTI